MSEAVDDARYIERRPASQARLIFSPDEELGDYLLRFVRPEIRTSLGHAGLFLYADDAIHAEEAHARPAQRTGKESVIHSHISRELRARGRTHSELARRLQFDPARPDSSGPTLRMDVILTELTAAAVMNHMKINPDRSVGAHITIPRSARAEKDDFMRASRELYERLMDDTRNPGVDSIKLGYTRRN